MTLEWVEPLVRWLGGLLAYITLSVLLYGIWLGTQHRAGRTGAWLRSGWFYLITAALFFGICFLGWKSLPLVVSTSSRTWMLAIGSLLYFSGISRALWARLTLGKYYFASTGLGVQRRRNL